MANAKLEGYTCTLVLSELIQYRSFFQALSDIAKAKNTTLEHGLIEYYKRLYNSKDTIKVIQQAEKQFVAYQDNIIEHINSLIVELLIKLQDYEKMVRSNN